jgi:tRNA (guanine37-N1)-methyltransferase
MNNLEYPHYTKPEEVLGMKVPKILLSGHHAKVQERREKNTKLLTKKSAT